MRQDRGKLRLPAPVGGRPPQEGEEQPGLQVRPDDQPVHPGRSDRARESDLHAHRERHQRVGQQEGDGGRLPAQQGQPGRLERADGREGGRGLCPLSQVRPEDVHGAHFEARGDEREERRQPGEPEEAVRHVRQPDHAHRGALREGGQGAHHRRRAQPGGGVRQDRQAVRLDGGPCVGGGGEILNFRSLGFRTACCTFVIPLLR